MKIYETLSLFPPADEMQLSVMRKMMERGILNRTIYVTKNPTTKEAEIVDGRARLALLGPKGVEKQTVAWDEASLVCYELNACSKPITVVQKACLHYNIFGTQVTDTWFPELMLRQVGQVKREDENLFRMLMRGELASPATALGIIRNRQETIDEPDGDKPEPRVMSREFYLKQILDSLEKNLGKIKRIGKYDADSLDEVRNWAKDIEETANRIADIAMDMASEDALA